jgi:hypothetical protein
MNSAGDFAFYGQVDDFECAPQLLCASSTEKIFLIEQCRSVCGRSGIAFLQKGY